MGTRRSGRRGCLRTHDNEDDGSSREPRDLLRATSYVTADEGSMLARPVARGMRRTAAPLPVAGAPDGSALFVAATLRGVYRRAPDKASFVLRDRRRGTMTEVSEGRVLPRAVGEVRRRVEHLAAGGVEEMGVTVGGSGGLGVVREAFRAEFRDAYEMVGSMTARRWDVCKGDVHALFEWFKMVENLVRAWVAVSQEGYVAGGRGEWGVREKGRVVRAAERVEGMKRAMLALDRRCGEMVERLRRRVEEFVEVTVGFLEEESRVVGAVLEEGFDSLVRRMGEEAGWDVVVLLGRGVRDTQWARSIAGWRAAKRVKERHWDYVAMFVDAEREYRALYADLAQDMDRAS